MTPTVLLCVLTFFGITPIHYDAEYKISGKHFPNRHMEDFDLQTSSPLINATTAADELIIRSQFLDFHRVGLGRPASIRPS